ncbi:MAG: hypothetical protein IKL16_04145 [Clostridia bacterium]|nr:hypothetical protein [Clostridia bacterium]
MKDFSDINIEKAWEEISRMQKESHFSEDDKEKYKCKCRFEKNEKIFSPPQNGNYFNKSSSIDEDKLLILALILILSKSCDDKLLMMALLYIIM